MSRIFIGVVWDPACGGGNIPERCKARGIRAVGTDIIDRGYSGVIINFLDCADKRADNIVTNPPFALAQEFVTHALTIATYKVAIVQRLAFLEGQKRGEWLDTTPLARVWVSRRRASMPPGDRARPAQIERGGAIAYAWYVWEKGYTGAPTLGWV